MSNFTWDLVFLDVTSFAVNLSQRRDASFYLCGEVCRYIHKLCFRCYTPDTTPLENAWFILLAFRTTEGKYMDADEFLIRHKLTSRINTASKQKAEGVHSGTGATQSVIQMTADAVKADFVTSVLHYIGYLLDVTLRQSDLNSDIVKGLAAFDPFILFRRPTEVALRHFDALYTTFHLRSWVVTADESSYRSEYLELLDYLRTTYSPNFDFTETSPDLIEFLMCLDFLQDRPRLLYLFKLCCLCITTSSPSLPAIVIGDINTSDFKGRFTDVALPSQSYMVGVPGSVAHCSSDDSMSKFSLLTSSFGRAAFASDYDPWTFVDTFGRSRIYKSLLSSYKAASIAPSASVRTVEETKSANVLNKSALTVPSNSKRKRSGSVGTRSTTSSTGGNSGQTSSK